MVKKYSEFINYPIKLYLSKDVRETVEEEEEPKDEEKKDDDESSDVKVEDEGEDEKPKEKKTKTITKTVWDWELLNEIKAIWMRGKEQIEEREYNEFYKSIARDH